MRFKEEMQGVDASMRKDDIDLTKLLEIEDE